MLEDISEIMSTSLTKSASNGTEKSLSPAEEQEKINEVRKSLGTLPDKLFLYCSDDSIARHLRARNWNAKKATKMLKDTLKWRFQYKPEEIHWNTKSTKGQIRYLVYCMENAILNLPAGQEQMVWLIDFQGFNMSHISVKVTRETAHVLQDHYPERLGVAILYNPPKFFESFWTVVKPFLEPKTYRKVKFVYSDDVNTKKIMEDLFDMDKLESSFGGNDQIGFNINDYAARMREDDKRMPLVWTRETALVDPEPTPAPIFVTIHSELDSEECGIEQADNSSSHENNSEQQSPKSSLAEENLNGNDLEAGDGQGTANLMQGLSGAQ